MYKNGECLLVYKILNNSSQKILFDSCMAMHYNACMQYNTYYRKDVWEKFKDEENKSELVNRLLVGFYKQLDDGFGRLEDGGEVQEFTLAEAKSFVKPVAKPLPDRFKTGVCKIHATPLTLEGKCLQKGCKNG